MFFNSPLPYLIIDAATLHIVQVNEAAAAFYGYEAAQFCSLIFLDIHTPDAKVKLLEQLQSSIGQKSWKSIVQQQKKEGDLITAELFAALFESAGIRYYQVTAIDITNRLTAHQTASSGKEKGKLYPEQSEEAVWRYELKVPVSIKNDAAYILDHICQHSYLAACNETMAALYGYDSPSGLEGRLLRQVLDLNSPQNIDLLKAFIHNGYRLINAETQELDRHQQTKYFVNNLIGIVEDGYLKRAWGTQKDITEVKKQEEKVKFLASMVEQTADVLTAADLYFRPITWNKGAEAIYGVSSEQVLGKDLRDFVDITYNNITKEEVREIIAKQGEWHGEMYFTRPTDKKDVTLFISYKTLTGEDGKILGYVAAATNITDIKEAELRLKESESRFSDIADTAPVGIWISGVNSKLSYVNKPLMDYIGIDVTNCQNFSWLSLVHEADFAGVVDQHQHHFNNRLPLTLIYRLKNNTGNYRWVQDSGIPRFLDDGTFLGYIGSMVDVHDTKAREEQLRYQATILENVLDIVITTNPEFTVQSWNQLAEHYYGFTEKEAKGKVLDQLIQLTYHHTAKEVALKELVQNGFWKGEVSYINKRDETKYILNTVKYIYDEGGNNVGILTVGRDITDRKEAEIKLLESEQFYRSLIADSLDGMLLTNDQGIITFVSPSIKNILGYEVEELLGKSVFAYVHPEEQEASLQSFKDKVHNPENSFVVIRLLKKEGEWLWCMVRGHNLLHHENVKSMVLYFHDDTLRKNANDALKESEQRFRHLIRDIPVGVILQDAAGNMLMWNKALLKILRVTEEELKNKHILNLIPDVIHENGSKFLKEERPLMIVHKLKKSVKDVVMGLKRATIKDRIWIIVNADPVLDERGDIVHTIYSVKDITERKKLEQKLFKEKITQQKLLTQATIDGQEKERREIGKELHDNIGQQLTTTKLYLDLANSTADEATTGMVSLALKSIGDAINEIRGICHSLLPSALDDLGLIDCVYDLIESISRTRPMHIKFNHVVFDETRIPENAKLMLFRIIQEQLNNITKHANANKVTITLANNEDDFSLELKDDGTGFDIKTIRRSLGLTNIRNRVELFGGKASIISSPGKGCCIKVFIPYRLQQVVN